MGGWLLWCVCGWFWLGVFVFRFGGFGLFVGLGC